MITFIFARGFCLICSQYLVHWSLYFETTHSDGRDMYGLKLEVALKLEVIVSS